MRCVLVFSCVHRLPAALHPKIPQKFRNRFAVWQNLLHLQQRNKISLAKSLIIRKLLAGFFMAVFAFGITPKITLHNLVATHIDGRAKTSVPEQQAPTQLSTASFNCQCDNLISESPFVASSEAAYTTVETAFAAYKRVYVEAVYSTQQFCSSLRGPPAC